MGSIKFQNETFKLRQGFDQMLPSKIHGMVEVADSRPFVCCTLKRWLKARGATVLGIILPITISTLISIGEMSLCGTCANSDLHIHIYIYSIHIHVLNHWSYISFCSITLGIRRIAHQVFETAQIHRLSTRPGADAAAHGTPEVRFRGFVSIRMGSEAKVVDRQSFAVNGDILTYSNITEPAIILQNKSTYDIYIYILLYILIEPAIFKILISTIVSKIGYFQSQRGNRTNGTGRNPSMVSNLAEAEVGLCRVSSCYWD